MPVIMQALFFITQSPIILVRPVLDPEFPDKRLRLLYVNKSAYNHACEGVLVAELKTQNNKPE
jgi:hypothetical protein